MSTVTYLREQAARLRELDSGSGDAKRLDDAADEIESLRYLLRRIDAVTTWEMMPFGRGFQEQIEDALRR
jgi:hypothetical protein